MPMNKKCCICDAALKRGNYRNIDGELYCYPCYQAGEHIEKPGPIEPEVLPPALLDNPFLQRAKINPLAEVEEKIQLQGKTETLAEVVQQFEQLRDIAAAMGKKNDIYHVSRIDRYLQEVLDVITSDDAIGALTVNILSTMKTGEMREIRALIQTIKDLAETKELLSQSFDDGRMGGQKKHLKLQLAFTNADGSMVAAKVET